MKYRIVNISYWKQFIGKFSPHLSDKIQGWMNDETHEMDEELAQNGLMFNCISEVPETEKSVEEYKRKEAYDEGGFTAVKDMKCHVCGFEAKSPLGLKAHMRKHERNGEV